MATNRARCSICLILMACLGCAKDKPEAATNQPVQPPQRVQADNTASEPTGRLDEASDEQPQPAASPLDDGRALAEQLHELEQKTREAEERNAELAAELKARDARERELQNALAEVQRKAVELERKVEPKEYEVRRPVVTVEKPSVTFEPRIELPRTPPKKSVDLIIKSVSVYSTKENGNPWDESGPPDLKVRVSAGGDSYTTSTEQGTTNATYNVKAIRVTEGDTLDITVSDGDVFSDDTIGSYEKKVTAATIAEGTVTWSFDRVSSIVLEFEP